LASFGFIKKSISVYQCSRNKGVSNP
jgi:hypothetical protein